MTATRSDGPLVFLSAARADRKWSDGLRNRLLAYPEVIVSWDRSQLAASEDWGDQIKEVLERASLAVVFLSQEYLSSSETSSYELIRLGDYAQTNGLRLFPILLEECDWRFYPFLHRVQVWGHDKPLGELDEETAGVELDTIAATIRTLVVGTPIEPTNLSANIDFSATALQVISAAGSLALKSNRGHVTASCLLFALAGAERHPAAATQPTLEFVRAALNQSSLYEREFEAFLKDGGPSAETLLLISGGAWRMSRTSAALVHRAAEIAMRVSANDSGSVHARHLFAALITPQVLGSRTVVDRLQRMGVDRAELCAEFRNFVREIAPSEIGSGWDLVLGTGSVSETAVADVGEAVSQASPTANPLTFKRTFSAFIPDRASYGPRTPGQLLDDSLGVRTYASHLAQLIAAKDTAMPLSIGLFGAWGAGKSHFIDLLDEELAEVVKNPGNAFHKKIVPIRFNAWHYLDTNLWANLVSEIFDQLFAVLESPEEKEKTKLENLKKQLAEQSALAAEANAAVSKAENVRKEAEKELRNAIQQRIKEEGEVSTLLDDLTRLPIADEVKKQLRQLARDLDLPKLNSSFKELEGRAYEVQSLAGRLKALGLAIFTGPGWWIRAVLLLVALVSPLVVSWLALYGSPWIKDLLAGTGRTIAQVITAVVALSTWLGAQVRAGNSIVTKLESAYDQVAKVRAQREATDAAAEAQAKLAEKKQTEEEARHTLHEAEEKLKVIKAELAELAPGRQLMRFLRERATAEDYRRHLGLVSLVRKDFQQLSNLLTGASSDRQNLPDIDRIILYIDDLDRCRAERVIEVLEAVHLLLAFPLFAVVVAVDPRWLRQSLLDHYPRLLGGLDDDAAKVRTRSLARPATPQDYLEKIFQVPFNLQTMERSGYELLVDHLFSVNGTQSKLSQKPITIPQVPEPEPHPQPDQPGSPVIAPEIPAKPIPVQPTDDSLKQPLEQQTSAPADPERLVLTQKEIEDIKRFQLLFQTPRAVKRLANTYSLIRVGVAQTEWSDYLGIDNPVPVYRVPLLLLAVTSAFPALARPWLIWLRTAQPAQWQIGESELKKLVENNTDTTTELEWERLQHCLKKIDLADWPPPDAQLLDKWVPRVARYSF